jgi:hypothetical protein
MDRYDSVIYLTPMVLGAFAFVFAAAWRFLGVRSNETTAGNAGRAMRSAQKDSELPVTKPNFRPSRLKSTARCGRGSPVLQARGECRGHRGADFSRASAG